jgi:hypothetical protein
MKTLKVSKLLPIVCFAAMFVMLAFVQSARAYLIDGAVNDWGVDLNAQGAAARGYLDAHTPTGGLDIDFATEDNADASRSSLWHGGWLVGPEYSVGNMCDAEALYLDNDVTNLYLAVIEGLPINGSAVPAGWSPSYIRPGDIAISVDGNTLYEYGLDLIDNSHASLVLNPTWAAGLYSDSNYRITSGTTLSTPVSFAYSSTAINGHYVMEASIPLSALDLSAGKNVTVHWGMSCGNDYLTLNGDVNQTPVPEPGSMALFGTGIIGALGMYRKRWMKRSK